jgi:molecular chaperone DnaK (HSP70)
MKWVAIDFGSSYSSATVMIDGKPVKVHPIGGLYNMYGFPTVAYVDENKNIKVCNDALAWRCQNPERFLKDFKLSIHEGELRYLGVNYLSIVANILKVIKTSAQLAINGETIDSAIITYPSLFSDVDPRIDVMREAAHQSGFKEIRFLKEAEAAAIYYNSLQLHQTGTLTLIYDLGGGTFDAALIEHKENGYSLIGASSGTVCGGQQFESAIYQYLNQKYKFKYDTDESLRFLQIDSIAKTCKNIKESLSINEKVAYPVPLLHKLVVELDRRTFNGIIEPLLERTFQECNSFVHSAGRTWTEISRIIMIGGSCAIPYVKEMIEKYLVGQNATYIKVLYNKSDEEVPIESLFAVSMGALLSIENNHTNGNLSDLCLADSLYEGIGQPKNWLEAAYFYSREYKWLGTERAYDRLMGIFQTVLDKLEIEDGNLVLEPIVDCIGENAADEMIEVLLKLQSCLENDGYENFTSDIFKLDFWISIIDEIIDVER